MSYSDKRRRTGYEHKAFVDALRRFLDLAPLYGPDRSDARWSAQAVDDGGRMVQPKSVAAGGNGVAWTDRLAGTRADDRARGMR